MHCECGVGTDLRTISSLYLYLPGYIFVFEFDQNDYVVGKKVLNLNEVQKIKMNKMKTENNIVKRGWIEKIFGGVGTQRVPNTY